MPLSRLSFPKKALLLGKALLDRRTPPAAKLLAVFTILYGISPLDLIPDVVPILGQTDDLLLIFATLLYLWQKTESIRRKLWQEGEGRADA